MKNQKIFDICVIGSSFAATGFLMSEKLKNKKILCIDLNNKYTARLSHLSQKELFNTHAKNKKFMAQDDTLGNTKIEKLDQIHNFQVRNSYMTGGYSKIWGSVNKTYTVKEQKEIIGYNLSKHIAIVNNKIHQITLKKNAINLKGSGISFPKATIAVNKEKCIECGNCMYGCPYDAIFSTNLLYEDLSSQFDKLDNYYLNKIIKKKECLVLELINNKTANIKHIKTRKIALGSGSINTAKILLRSFRSISRIFIKDSAVFYVPLFKKKIINDNNIDLASSVFSLKHYSSSIFIQIYAFKYYLLNQILSLFGFFTNRLDFLSKFFFLFMGFLPSKYSPKAEISVNNINNKFQINIKKNNKTKIVVKKILLKLKEIGFASNYILISFMLKYGKPFSSYHFGSLEIQDQNKKNMKIYRKKGLILNKFVSNIYLIDSSIFKSIPSGPLSLLIMANAYRIADLIDE
jgi:ferredoxin